MDIDLQMKEISCFGSTIPLDPKMETHIRAWLPDEMQKNSKLRQREYLAGRFCAVSAAKKLGYELLELPSGNAREPIWPTHLVGSISHSKKFAVACVGRNGNFRSIGIDSEEMIEEARAFEISSVVANNDERNLIASFYLDSRLLAFTVLFAGKESLYKALYPLCRCFIDFHEAKMIHLSFETKEFTIVLDSSNPRLKDFCQAYTGTFSLIDQTVVTVIALR
jgi:enterobactin synthetase component D